MPVFQVDIEKMLGGEYWTNVYHVFSPDLTSAAAAAVNLVTAERGFHLPQVQFTRARTALYPIGTTQSQTAVTGGTGLLAGGNELEPLFVTLRVDFPATIGRPSRKYYRGVLTEIDVTFMTLNPDSLARYAPLVLQLLTVSGGSDFTLCDRQGDQLTSAIVYNGPQMRQLRRGSRRRATPILP